MSRLRLLLAAVVLLSACHPPDALPLGWGQRFRLRPPGDGPACFSTSLVELTLPDGRTEALLTTLENRPDRLTVVASSPVGATLFTATLRGGIVELQAPFPLPQGLDPRGVLALVQLVHWPLASLHQGLTPDLELREDDTLRTVRRRGSVLLTLRREGPVVHLEAPSLRLKARITPLEDSP